MAWILRMWCLAGSVVMATGDFQCPVCGCYNCLCNSYSRPMRVFSVIPNVIPISRAQVDAALLLLEHADILAANLVRDYIDGLEGRLRVAELEADTEPGS